LKHFNIHYSFVVIILLLFICSVNAQQKYKSERNADIVEYTSRDGLPTSNISSVAQTPDGYIWIASPQGTVRFNGYEFAYVGQEYGVPDMQAVFYDSLKNSLYFASPEKFIRFTDGKFTVFDKSNGYMLNGASGQVITFIKMDSKGRIWIGSETPYIDMPYNGGLTLFSHGKFTVFDSLTFPLHNATGFVETPYGDMIFSSSGKNTQNGEAAYIALYKGNSFTVIDEIKGMKVIYANRQNDMFGSSIDNEGNTWIAFRGNSDFALDKEERGSGVLMYDGDQFHQFPGLQKYIRPMTSIGTVFFHKQLGKVFASINSQTPREFNPDQPNLFEFENGRWIPSEILKEINTVRNLKSGQKIEDFRYNGIFFIKKSQTLPNCIVLGTEGLIASSENPAQYFTLDQDRWEKYEAIQGIPILELKKGLMVKTTKGIGFYHPEESKMLTEKDGLVSTIVGIPNFYVDRNQIIWMSFSYSELPTYAETNTLGLNLWDGSRLRKFSEKDGLSSDITFNFLHDTQDRIWIGTSKGITQIREFQNTKGEWVFKFKKVATSSNREYSATTLLETKSGDVYTWQNYVRPSYGELGSANFYLGKFDGEKFIEIPSPFSEMLQKKQYQLVHLREDRKGQLWLACHFADNVSSLNSVKTEIMIFNGKEWYAPPKSWMIPNDQLHFVGELDNGAYYLTAGHFYKFDSKRFIDLSDSVNTDADFRILKGASVAGTKTDNQVGDRLYIRLRNRGLVIFNGTKLRFHTPKDGFVATDIHDPLQDLRGNLFFASMVGAVMITKDNFRIFYDDENIAAGGPNAVTIDENGNFFKYYNGIGLYIDQQTEANINLKITSIAVNARSYFYSFPNNLSYSENSLLFNYSALNFNDPDKTTFEHILEGYDKEWSKPSGHSFAEYQNLPSGKFNFRVRAKTANGFAMDETNYQFSIFPPWWSTWWAYAIYVLIVLFVLYSLRKFELKRQLKNARIKESELKAKAAEAQSRAIQAESERKTKELEEARKLQLSMLPKELPQIHHLDIAVYMQTATEVGGDFYDFSFKEDGSLNVVLGDATGHGMKAGIMVSSMKSIFTTNASKMAIEDFFETANNGIKSMNLKRMMMGLIMLNINKNTFKLINAGMPPVFLYRKKTKRLNEITEHGMPIGAMNQSRYNVKEEFLEKGDILLLMSDGMPELKNANDEMYGYKRIRKGFEDVAEKAPEEIVSYLKNEGAGWINNADPDDDVTFVVIKVK